MGSACRFTAVGAGRHTIWTPDVTKNNDGIRFLLMAGNPEWQRSAQEFEGLLSVNFGGVLVQKRPKLCNMIYGNYSSHVAKIDTVQNALRKETANGYIKHHRRKTDTIIGLEIYLFFEVFGKSSSIRHYRRNGSSTNLILLTKKKEKLVRLPKTRRMNKKTEQIGGENFVLGLQKSHIRRFLQKKCKTKYKKPL